MKETTKKMDSVLFDPGYAPIALESLGSVGYNYYMFSAISNVKVKKLKFKPLTIKLEYNLKIEIAFYLGCLLWANYIKQFKNAKIEGNKLYKEECKEEDYTGEIDFLKDFLENKYPRDYKYFLNKPFELDEKYLPILNTYRDFLVINEGFVNCANTDDIKLPKNLKTPKDLDKINSEIQRAIKSEDLTILFESYQELF